MSEYECKRCGVIFDVKKNLVQHLKKKKECISINSESSREELLNDIIEKEGVECEGCGKKYSNIYNMRRHSCKLVENVKEELEKRITELERMLKKEQINQVAKTIDNSTTNNDNRRIKTIDNSTTNNITLVINDIDSLEGIDYILKDPKFVERILKWVTDKKGLLKYMDDRYYNPKRPENRGIRKVDNESIELRMRGDNRE